MCCGAEYVAGSATGEPHHKNRRKEEGKVSLSLVANDTLDIGPGREV